MKKVMFYQSTVMCVISGSACILLKSVSVNELTSWVKGHALLQLSCQRSRVIVFRLADVGGAKSIRDKKKT